MILELFSGTESFSNVAREKGYDCTTIDNDPQHNPKHLVDILDITPEWLDERGIDDVFILWASPPCTCFSLAGISHHFNKIGFNFYPKSEQAEISLKIINHMITIIEYLKPKYFFIENPRGTLRKMPMMTQFSRITVNYCQYGDSRMKPTDIWGTIPPSFPIRRCHNNDPCHESAPRGSKTGTQGLKNSVERSIVPPELCRLLLECCEKGWKRWF